MDSSANGSINQVLIQRVDGFLPNLANGQEKKKEEGKPSDQNAWYQNTSVSGMQAPNTQFSQKPGLQVTGGET